MNQILIGKGEQPVYLLAKYGNRHGLIAGATGTGKTISLMVLAEGFSRLGVSVFMADVKAMSPAWRWLVSATRRSNSVLPKSVLRATLMRRTRCCSGTCSARLVIRYAPRSAKSARAC